MDSNRIDSKTSMVSPLGVESANGIYNGSDVEAKSKPELLLTMLYESSLHRNHGGGNPNNTTENSLPAQ